MTLSDALRTASWKILYLSRSQKKLSKLRIWSKKCFQKSTKPTFRKNSKNWHTSETWDSEQRINGFNLSSLWQGSKTRKIPWTNRGKTFTRTRFSIRQWILQQIRRNRKSLWGVWKGRGQRKTHVFLERIWRTQVIIGMIQWINGWEHVTSSQSHLQVHLWKKIIYWARCPRQTSTRRTQDLQRQATANTFTKVVTHNNYQCVQKAASAKVESRQETSRVSRT